MMHETTHHQLQHSDPNLYHANHISITFKFQKRDDKNDTIIQEHLGHLQLCPVLLWVSTIQYMWSYPGTTPDSPAHAIIHLDGKLSKTSGTNLLSMLHTTIDNIRVDELSFTSTNERHHSLQKVPPCQWPFQHPSFYNLD